MKATRRRRSGHELDPEKRIMRRFTRTPYYTGKDDPERGEVRGTLKLGETVIIETPGGADGDLYPGVVPELTEPRGSRGASAG